MDKGIAIGVGGFGLNFWADQIGHTYPVYISSVRDQMPTGLLRHNQNFDVIIQKGDCDIKSGIAM